MLEIRVEQYEVLTASVKRRFRKQLHQVVWEENPEMFPVGEMTNTGAFIDDAMESAQRCQIVTSPDLEEYIRLAARAGGDFLKVPHLASWAGVILRDTDRSVSERLFKLDYGLMKGLHQPGMSRKPLMHA